MRWDSKHSIESKHWTWRMSAWRNSKRNWEDIGFPTNYESTVNSVFEVFRDRICKLRWLWLQVTKKPSEKAMATHSSTLAWKLPWTEEPGRQQSMGSWRVRHDWLHFHFSLSCIGEGNGNPLQYSCLENPRDRGAYWAAVYGVAQSRTRLTRLSSSSGSN